MANGKPGDDPIMDIIRYGLPTYSPSIDDLILRIAKLSGTKESERLREIVMEAERRRGRGARAQVLQSLEARLTVMYERSRAEAIERGWEVEDPP